MGCGCSARRKPSAGTVIGYLVTYPDGTTTPESQPFMSLTEAKIEVRQAGGGTIRKLVKRR
jgi:hypothetical protein